METSTRTLAEVKADCMPLTAPASSARGYIF